MSSNETYHNHHPVLLEESVDYLITDSSGIYIDATLGGGGHSRLILSHLDQKAQLLGIDQDDEALAAAHKRIGTDKRFSTIKGNFGYLRRLISPEMHGNVSGILLDLGVSTHQITSAERGFTFQKEGPLDMRMGNLQGITAYQVVNEYSYKKLRDVIYHLGEERLSRQIAHKIIDLRPIKTTTKLRDAVEEVVKGQYQIKSVARVFQAIRIEVNSELEMLRNVLEQALELLALNGRIVAISYQSLEDRIVKHFFRTGNHEGKIKKDFYGHPLNPIEEISGGIVRPSEDEISQNPAARSAKMRVAQKIKDPEA